MDESIETRVQRIEAALRALSDSPMRSELVERAERLVRGLSAYPNMAPAQKNFFHFELDRCECLLMLAPAQHVQDADTGLGVSLTYALSTSAIRRLLKIRAWLLNYPTRYFPSIPVGVVLKRQIKASTAYSRARQLGQFLRTSVRP